MIGILLIHYISFIKSVIGETLELQQSITIPNSSVNTPIDNYNTISTSAIDKSFSKDDLNKVVELSNTTIMKVDNSTEMRGSKARAKPNEANKSINFAKKESLLAYNKMIDIIDDLKEVYAKDICKLGLISTGSNSGIEISKLDYSTKNFKDMINEDIEIFESTCTNKIDSDLNAKIDLVNSIISQLKNEIHFVFKVLMLYPDSELSIQIKNKDTGILKALLDFTNTVKERFKEDLASLRNDHKSMIDSSLELFKRDSICYTNDVKNLSEFLKLEIFDMNQSELHELLNSYNLSSTKIFEHSSIKND